MDRRQQKTRAAIFAAFSKLLGSKRYGQITVQDIIDEANIGRSTFYAHFDTKDELLHAMCAQIFDHVFSRVLDPEQTHDFSSENDTFSHKLTHLLYHLKERKADILRLLNGESADLFLRYFMRGLTQLFSGYEPLQAPVPKDYWLHHHVTGFAQAVQWWAGKDMQYTPEEMVAFYHALTR